MKHLFTNRFVSLSFLLAITTSTFAQDNYLWSWGYTISTSSKMGPQNLADAPTGKWVSIATGDAGAGYAGGVLEDGTMWIWYKGIFNPATQIPTQYGADNDWQMLTMGAEMAIALKKDGTLWSWCFGGANLCKLDGVLGRGQDAAGFGQIGSDNDWVDVQAERSGVMALKADGTLWGWGEPDLTMTTVYEPVQLGTDDDWVSLSYGSVNAAIKSDGTLWIIQDDNARTAEQVGTDNDWKAVASHKRHHYLAIKMTDRYGLGG